MLWRGVRPRQRLMGQYEWLSATLGFERTHLLVEFRGDFLERVDCGVVHFLLVGAAQAILLGLEFKALVVGVHVGVVFLQGLHRREHFLLAGGESQRHGQKYSLRRVHDRRPRTMLMV